MWFCHQKPNFFFKFLFCENCHVLMTFFVFPSSFLSHYFRVHPPLGVLNFAVLRARGPSRARLLGMASDPTSGGVRQTNKAYLGSQRCGWRLFHCGTRMHTRTAKLDLSRPSFSRRHRWDVLIPKWINTSPITKA